MTVIAGNTGVMTLGIGLQIALQGGYFILVTRTMGAPAYGAFISVSAIAGIVGAFAGWGGDQLLIRAVARDSTAFSRSLGQALIYFAVSAPVLTVLALIGVPFLIDSAVPFLVVLLVVLSDVIFARANSMAVNCFQAFERGRDMAVVGVTLFAVRAAAALIWRLALPHHDLVSWAWFYFASSLIAGLFGMARVWTRLGRPVWRAHWSEWREGGYFALQMASFLGFRDIDKPLVVDLAGLQQAGLYAAAFRIADVASVPVRALMYSTYVRFFQHGAQGAHGSLGFARKLLPIGFAMGLFALLGVAAASTFAVAILGRNYAGLGPILLLMSPLPLLYALYYIGADALISGGHVGYRTLAQLVLPAIDISLCLVMVPRFGAAGAAIAATLTHAVLVILVWSSALYLGREPTPETAS
jgi:O-antigen/teichoic acid export membrane protein